MNVLIVGNAKCTNLNKFVKKKYDEIYFFCNNLENWSKFKSKTKILVIQDFTLNFDSINFDNWSYHRYFKTLNLKKINEKKIKMILIGKSFSKKYYEYQKLNIIEKVNYKKFILNLYYFLGFKIFWSEFKLIELFKILLLTTNIIKKVNSSMRPSNGLFMIINQINNKKNIEIDGFSSIDDNYSINNDKALLNRPHYRIDKLIQEKVNNLF